MLAASGAAVAAVDQSREKAERVAQLSSSNGGRCIALEADVSDRTSVEAMVERVISELGGVDVLVNNAAIYPLRPWTEIEEDEWDRVMAVNLKASCAPGLRTPACGSAGTAASSTSPP